MLSALWALWSFFYTYGHITIYMAFCVKNCEVLTKKQRKLDHLHRNLLLCPCPCPLLSDLAFSLHVRPIPISPFPRLASTNLGYLPALAALAWASSLTRNISANVAAPKSVSTPSLLLTLVFTFGPLLCKLGLTTITPVRSTGMMDCILHPFCRTSSCRQQAHCRSRTCIGFCRPLRRMHRVSSSQWSSNIPGLFIDGID